MYDVKFYGRHKAKFVAEGDQTNSLIGSVYSGVVSLEGIRIVTLLVEMNDMELWTTDVGNTYLESYTEKKVCFIAGPEFGTLEGLLMIIVRALYGLKSSEKRWHERLFDILVSLGFTSTKTEEDIWIKDVGSHYEYIMVYVDDLLIASKKPWAIIDGLEAVAFALKGTGPGMYHLGCDYFRD
jgi:Reverse transcriptase (RNA-dependent DNA polymerase)